MTLPAPFTPVHWEMPEHGKMVDIRRAYAMLGSDYEMLPGEGFPTSCVSPGEDHSALDLKPHITSMQVALGPHPDHQISQVTVR